MYGSRYSYGSSYTNALAGLSVGWLIAIAAVAVICLIAVWKMFKKAGEPGWKCLIPIYNLYMYWKIAWKGSKFWVWFFSSAIAAAIAGILIAVLKENAMVPLIILGVVWGIYTIYLQIKMSVNMAHRFNKNGAFGFFLLFLLGIGNLILGFGRADYDANRA